MRNSEIFSPNVYNIRAKQARRLSSLAIRKKLSDVNVCAQLGDALADAKHDERSVRSTANSIQSKA